MLQQIPVQKLEAVLYKDLSANTQVINLLHFEYEIWVHLPSFCQGCRLFQIDQFLPNLGEDLEMLTSVKQEPCKPWVRVTSNLLNKDVGQHIYRLYFINSRTEDIFSLYISYIVQNDNPEKPYVYMDEARKQLESNECEVRL